MAFRPEEILEEFAEAGSYGTPEWLQDFRYTVLTRGTGTGKTKAQLSQERYARVKADPVRLARRRQIAREAQRRIYAKRPAGKKNEISKRRYQQIKADPVQWAALLERQRIYKANRRKAKRGSP